MEIVRARRRRDSVTSNDRTLVVYAPAPGGYATRQIEGSDLPSGACTEACDTELASTKEPVASPRELISPNPGAAGRPGSIDERKRAVWRPQIAVLDIVVTPKAPRYRSARINPCRPS